MRGESDLDYPAIDVFSGVDDYFPANFQPRRGEIHLLVKKASMVTSFHSTCVVYGQDYVFNVNLSRDATIATLSGSISQNLQDVLPGVSTGNMTLQQAWKKKAFMTIPGQELSLIQSGKVAIDSSYPMFDLSKRIGDYFAVDFQPRRKEVHVLVTLESTRYLNWAPVSLVTTSGSKWDFQSPLGTKCFRNLRQAIVSHYDAWKHDNRSESSHPLFITQGGPGTGKSRLLDEFLGLAQSAIGDDGAMANLLQRSFEFKVSFRSQEYQRCSFEASNKSIGTRMLFQLQNTSEWKAFSEVPAHQVDPSAALSKLAELASKPLAEMCVILCVDDLDMNIASSVLGYLCDLINTSACFLIAIVSSASSTAVQDFLAASKQKKVVLRMPRLSRPSIGGVDIFSAFNNTKNEVLVRLLVDDMGGYGRGLEALFDVLKGMDPNVSLNFELVIKMVLQRLNKAYPMLRSQLENMRETFLAVIARRHVNQRSKFGSASLNDVLLSGLVRQEGAFLVCPYILYLMIDTNELHPWPDIDWCVPLQSRISRKPWESWERFNCIFRVLKSCAYSKDRRVNWMHLHYGARFGDECNRDVKETHRTYFEANSQLKTKSKGYSKGSCSCDRDLSNPRFLYQPAAGSSSGDSFLCLQGTDGWFSHEVHQYKRNDRSAQLSLAEFQAEKKKAAARDDYFVLYCTGEVSPQISGSVIKKCAVVDRLCWKDYYGPFSARMYFMTLILPPCLNNCSDLELRNVAGVGELRSRSIINARRQGSFQSYEDAHNRTGVPLAVLRRFDLTPLRLEL